MLAVDVSVDRHRSKGERSKGVWLWERRWERGDVKDRVGN
jgi:hypothetical protein